MAAGYGGQNMYQQSQYSSAASTTPSQPGVAIDQATYQRFKDLEISHVTITSGLEEKIRNLERINENLMLEKVTNESLYTELMNQKNKFMEAYQREQRERMAERQLWNSSQVQSDAQRRDYQQLLDQLQAERSANQQMDAMIQQMNQTRLEDPRLREEVMALRKQLDEELHANRLLDQRALGLIHELEDLKSNPPQVMKNDSKELDDLKIRLENERALFEQNLQAKQIEISKLHKLVEQSEATESQLKIANSSLAQLEGVRAREQEKSRILASNLRQREDEIRELRSNALSDPSTAFTPNNGNSGMKITSVKPPKGFEPDLWDVFLASDQSKSGQLDAGELEFALSKGPWPKLSLRSAWLLIRIVDPNGDYVLLDKFQELWAFVLCCKVAFKKFDQQQGNTWGFVESSALLEILNDIGIKRLPKKALALTLKRRGLEGESI